MRDWRLITEIAEQTPIPHANGRRPAAFKDWSWPSFDISAYAVTSTIENDSAQGIEPWAVAAREST